jgi:hypothetical protein
MLMIAPKRLGDRTIAVVGLVCNSDGSSELAPAFVWMPWAPTRGGADGQETRAATIEFASKSQTP